MTVKRNNKISDWSTLAEDYEQMAQDLLIEAKKYAAVTMLENVTQSTADGGYTPISTGNLMSNTVVSFTPDYSVNDSYDRHGDTTLVRGKAVIALTQPYDSVFIQNNTPYNLQAEYTGWAVTPPYRYFSKAYYSTLIELDKRF